jgi:hypothetical protein
MGLAALFPRAALARSRCGAAVTQLPHPRRYGGGTPGGHANGTTARTFDLGGYVITSGRRLDGRALGAARNLSLEFAQPLCGRIT